MKTDIFIVSVGKHFKYLKYCLRSIRKFASGFNRVVLMIPLCDRPALFSMMSVMSDAPDNLHVETFTEWHDKGMLHHMLLEMDAPKYCSGADAIVHFDSDWAFNEPITPDDYFRDGKPICVYASFDWLCNTQQANLRMWQEAVERAIGKPVPYEMMRWPRLIHIPIVYAHARAAIEAHTRQSMEKYIAAQRNEFPQTFAEYPTLGAIAWRYYHDQYHWINQETEPFPPRKLYEAWSHCDPTPENIAEYKRIGIYD